MSDCPKHDENIEKCNCSYSPCERKGTCCDCLHYHLAMRQLPACCFPDEIEQTYDRTFKRFAQLYK